MLNRKKPVCSQLKTVPKQSIKYTYVFILHHEQISELQGTNCRTKNIPDLRIK